MPAGVAILPMNNESVRSYLLRGGAWAIMGKGLSAVLGLAMSALLARLLSPDDMGGYFLAFNLATFLSIFPRMGLENTFLRFIPEALETGQPERAYTIIYKGLALSAGVAFLLAALWQVGIGKWVLEYVFHSPTLAALSGFIAIWLVLRAFQFLFGAIFRAFQDIRLSVFFGGLVTTIVIITLLIWGWLLFDKLTLKKVFMAVVIAGVANIILAFWFLRKQLVTLPKIVKNDITYTSIAAYSWPLLVNTFANFIYANSSLWIVAAFCSEQDTALYGAAARLVLLAGLLLTMVNSVIPPLIARLNVTNQKERLEYILRTTATLAAIPTLGVLGAFMFFGETILRLTYGGFYRAATLVLVILSIGQMANVFVGSCGYTLIIAGYRKTIMYISLFSGAVEISLGIFLVQKYGVLGVAIASAIAMTCQQFLMLYFAKTRYGVWTHFSISHLVKFIIKGRRLLFYGSQD